MRVCTMVPAGPAGQPSSARSSPPGTTPGPMAASSPAVTDPASCSTRIAAVVDVEGCDKLVRVVRSGRVGVGRDITGISAVR